MLEGCRWLLRLGTASPRLVEPLAKGFAMEQLGLRFEERVVALLC